MHDKEEHDSSHKVLLRIYICVNQKLFKFSIHYSLIIYFLVINYSLAFIFNIYSIIKIIFKM